MSNKIISIFKSECFKVRHNRGSILIILVPVIVVLITDIYLIYKSFEESVATLPDPWKTFLGQSILFAFALLLPLIIAVSCFSFNEAEYKNKNFRLLFTLPIRKRDVFICKMLYLAIIAFIAILIWYCIFVISGYVLDFFEPAYNFSSHSVIIRAGIYFLRIFIAMLAIFAIQYFLGLIFENFVIPVGIACFSTMMSIAAARWKYIDFSPYYSFYQSAVNFMAPNGGVITNVELINIGYILIFTIGAYFVFKNKKV